jgi:hypothetical protein
LAALDSLPYPLVYSKNFLFCSFKSSIYNKLLLDCFISEVMQRNWLSF